MKIQKLLHANLRADTIDCIGVETDAPSSRSSTAERSLRDAQDDMYRMTSSTARVITRTAIVGVCLLLVITPAAAIDIEQVEWGFDGQVVSHRFNVLSVLVGNRTPETFEGVLELHKMLSAGQRVGAILAEPVFLAPYSSRWVQFYPYATQDWEEYTLRWGPRAADQFALPKPRMGEAARIILDDPDSLLSSRGILKPFRDNLFPPMSTATDPLQALFVDHVPRWEEARRTAFLDWLKRGGLVHVLQDSNGEFPVFPKELAVLNSPLERQRVGSGLVFRHHVDREALDKAFLQQIRTEERQDSSVGEDLIEDIVVERGATGSAAQVKNASGAQVSDQHFFGLVDADWTILGNLKSMTNPHHNWPAIYGLALIYSLVIFPGCYLLGRQRLDYRLVFGAMLLAVVAFSLAFGWIGRRGYGEATSVNSLAIVRPLDEGFCDVTGWSATFVTTGGDYEITHAGSGRMYSTAQVREAVNGFIDNGAEAKFVADIPPFSSRPFTYRAKVECAVPQLKVTQWRAGKYLHELAFTAESGLPEDVQSMHALYRDHIYNLKKDASGWTLASRQQPLPVFLQLGDPAGSMRFAAPGSSFGFDPFYDDAHAPEERFADLAKPLIARSLDLKDGDRMQDFTLLGDRVRVFVYAPLPEELFLQHDEFTLQQGRALYCIDLLDPENR